MAEGFIDSVRNGKRYTVSDYITAYDNGIAFDEVEYISTSLLSSVPTDDFFRNFKKLRYVNLPNVTDLPSYAFSGCSMLREVVLPKVSILSNAAIFSGCTNLSKVKFSTNLEIKSTAESLFAGCNKLNNLTSIRCNDRIPNYAFSGCSSLTNFAINGSCSVIGFNAFYDCIGFNNITASNVKEVKSNAFERCSKLTVAIFSASLSSIGACAFSGCIRLSNVNKLISNVEFIGQQAFYSCAIQSLSINGDPSIGNFAFYGCDSLSKIYAPNLTKLQGLPYIKDMTLGNIISIYQVFSNSYFYPVMDLSTVQYVFSNAYLSIFRAIYLENCFSYCVQGNIGGSITEEFILPKWSWDDPYFSVSQNSSTYGFAGYKMRYNNSYAYYMNLRMSKLELMYNMGLDTYRLLNPINFPAFSSTFSSAVSNIALYSCIAYLGLFDFAGFIYRSGFSSTPLTLLNYFSKLSTIKTTRFMVPAASSGYSNQAINYKSLRSMYFISDTSNKAYLQLVQGSYDTLPSILDIYGNDIDEMHISISGDFHVNFSGLSSISKVMLNIIDNSVVSEISVPNIQYISLSMFINHNHCMDNLPNLSNIDFNNLEMLEYTNVNSAIPFNGVSALSAINMPKLKYISPGSIFANCGHISELNLPELIGYSTDFSISESSYWGISIPYTTFDSVTLGIYSFDTNKRWWVNTEVLNLPRCSSIEIHGVPSSGFESNIKSINAPVCDRFYANISSSLNFKMENVRLSEYVNDFKFIGLSYMSVIDVKTSNSYNITESAFGMCYSLKNIFMRADGDISMNANAKYLSSVTQNISIDNINLVAGGTINITHNPFTTKEDDSLYRHYDRVKYMTLSANSIYLTSNEFTVTEMFSIKANYVSITGQLFDIRSNYGYLARHNGLIILDTPTYISEPFFSVSTVQDYSLINCIIKVKPSLVSVYQNDSAWQLFPNIGFIEI